MLLKKMALSALAGALILGAGLTQAADQTKDQTQDRTQLQDQIYGSQLMTEQERVEHRAKMRSLKTAQEREAYQLEQHKRMQERAKVKGVTLPPEPMMRPGGGMGPGGDKGSGGGMGPGGDKGSGGMGPGGGMGAGGSR